MGPDPFIDPVQEMVEQTADASHLVFFHRRLEQGVAVEPVQVGLIGAQVDIG